MAHIKPSILDCAVFETLHERDYLPGHEHYDTCRSSHLRKEPKQPPIKVIYFPCGCVVSGRTLADLRLQLVGADCQPHGETEDGTKFVSGYRPGVIAANRVRVAWEPIHMDLLHLIRERAKETGDAKN